MFRLSHFMRTLTAPQAPGTREAGARTLPAAAAPVVIWNVIRRCNLTCAHCYAVSADIDFAGELSTAEAFGVVDDLADMRVPALVLSGGEPLLRPDLFAIARRARERGLYVGLSTNGTLVDAATARRIARHFDYVGVSLDGRPATHDRFRRSAGAFARSLAALRALRDAGAKVGMRYTLTQAAAADLPWLLDLAQWEGISRFYLSHLNYAGRGNVNRRRDALHATTRAAMELLFHTAWSDAAHGCEREIVTGNNDADGVYFLRWLERRYPERARRARALLEAWGGNASGVAVANIDNLGEVHPDTYWWDHSLGNVRRRRFSAIWRDGSDPILAGLRRKPRPLTGRCRACAYGAICGGNTRTRARQLTGDTWAEDPGCYLEDAELGIEPGAKRVALTPYTRRAAAPAAP
jgi:heme d1 biosynthesis radical SAM protein NirJ